MSPESNLPRRVGVHRVRAFDERVEYRVGELRARGKRVGQQWPAAIHRDIHARPATKRTVLLQRDAHLHRVMCDESGVRYVLKEGGLHPLL